MKRLLYAAVVFALAFAGNVFAQSFNEGFDAVPPAGWTVNNQSEPLGTNAWFQGNDKVFPAHAGVPSAYAACNFNSGADLATISDWLITPLISFNNGSRFSFFTRTSSSPATFPDRLQLRLSINGACSPGVGAGSTGDFAWMLLEINPVQDPAGYPDSWTSFAATLSGLPAGTSTGCFAFRYYVTFGGPGGSFSDYIGVDTVAFAFDEVIFADGFQS